MDLSDQQRYCLEATRFYGGILVSLGKPGRQPGGSDDTVAYSPTSSYWRFCVLPRPCPLSLPGRLLPFLLNPTSLLRAGPRGSLLLLLSVSHLLPPCRDGTLQNLVSVLSLPWLGPSFFPSPYLALPLSSRPMFLSSQGKSQLAYPSDT